VIIQHESLSRTQFKHCRNTFLCKPRKGEHWMPLLQFQR